MSFTAVYYRHYQRKEHRFETLEEAKRFLDFGSDEGDLYAVCIKDNKTNKISWVSDHAAARGIV